jgi:5-methylcytosine-specific restriction endonuclease McrA
MPGTRTCWRCGRTVAAEDTVRKQVRTRGSSRTWSYYGHRTLCRDCARHLNRVTIIQGLLLLIAVAAGAVWWFFLR